MSLVHTAPARPYRLLLASAMASSSVSNGMTERTGPNTSSHATVMVGLTLVSTVGWTKYPPSASSARPPTATVAPSVAADSRNESTLRYCGSVATGPISVPAARGSPRRMARARSAILSTSASCTPALTSSREPAMQVCPVAANTPASTPLQAASRSASSKTTCADLPPSSSSTPVMFAAAALATSAPTPVEPVNATLSTPGCAASALPTAGPNPVTTLKVPGGNPASSISAASSTAEAGE